MNDQQQRIKKGLELELRIESLAFGGLGLARKNDFVVFVKGAIPGQKVLCRIYKKKKGYAEAYILKVLTQSSRKIKERCEHFYICSKLQILSYPEQIKQKSTQVKDAFHRLSGFKDFKLNNIISAKKKYNYRNKMEFTFSSNRWVLDSEPEGADRSFALGLHIPGRYDKILNIDKCNIQPKTGNKILKVVHKVCESYSDLKPYDPKTHNGFLRYLMIRYGFNTDQIMVNIVTAYEDVDKISPIIDAIKNEVPEVTSIVNNINTKKADVSYGEYEIVFHGNRTIEEKMNNLVFDISANSFFQTNTLQGEKLYEQVAIYANLSGNEIIYDLYSGTGTISLFLAKNAKHVYGFEVIRSSLENANQNAIKNDIKNATFLKANLDTYFKTNQLPRNILKPDIVVIDPPRAGMHPDMVNSLSKLNAEKIIYVSCNPTTQARDVRILSDKGYDINKATMIDMFPHTPHIETVVLLQKKN